MAPEPGFGANAFWVFVLSGHNRLKQATLTWTRSLFLLVELVKYHTPVTHLKRLSLHLDAAFYPVEVTLVSYHTPEMRVNCERNVSESTGQTQEGTDAQKRRAGD